MTDGLLINPYRFGGAFNPLSLGWHAAYWADDPGWSNPGDGNAVSSWRDGSGNGRNATEATGTRQPLFRSTDSNLSNHGSVDFIDAGGDDTLTATNWSNLSSPYSVVWLGYLKAGYNAVENHRFVDMGTGDYPVLYIDDNIKISLYNAGEVAGPAASVGAKAIRGKFVNGTSVLNANGTGYTGSTTSSQAAGRFIIANDTSASLGLACSIGFVGIISGDVTANGGWSAFVSWASSYYGLTIA